MVSFQTINPILGKFWRALDWKRLIQFMHIGNILRPFGIFYDHLEYDHLEYFMTIWYILRSLCKLFLVLVSSTDKNLATQLESTRHPHPSCAL
jgi:hypothetical protein